MFGASLERGYVGDVVVSHQHQDGCVRVLRGDPFGGRSHGGP